MFVPSRRWIAALTFSLTLFACDGTDPFPEVDDGDFNATVSGGTSLELAGFAFFALIEATAHTPGYFVIRLWNDNEEEPYDILFLRSLVGLPAPGTYPLTTIESSAEPPEQLAAALIRLQGAVATARFTSTAGTITIDSPVTGEQLQGSFDFTAVGTDTENPGQVMTITVTGSFRAVREDRIDVPQF